MGRSITYMIPGKAGKLPINVLNVGPYGELVYPKVVRITLDGFASTEKTDMFRQEDLIARWDLLAGFADLNPPDDLPLHVAVAYTEAIWLDVLLDNPQVFKDELIGDSESAFGLFINDNFLWQCHSMAWRPGISIPGGNAIKNDTNTRQEPSVSGIL